MWYKENAKESNRDCKSYGTIGLNFNIAINWFKLIVFFF